MLPNITTIPHKLEEIESDHTIYPVTPPISSGHLKVSPIHTLFYAVYGNPNGVPVIVLHGGPGAGCSDLMTRYFDLNRWFVVMFDQRGAMRSEPAGCMEENTTPDLVGDIEKLRMHLKIDRWFVFGGSWGSTLGLVYGETHPERCLGFVLRGIFLGRPDDHLHLFHGMGLAFPEAREPFIEYIPVAERGDLFSAYYRRIMDPDPAVHLAATRAFMRFDFTCSTHSPDPASVEKQLKNDSTVLCIAKTFFHYAKNRFFLEPDQILSNMDRIHHLPAILVQGRWDVICPPEMAYKLFKRWPNAGLWMVSNGGHSGNEDSIAVTLAKATNRVLSH